MNTYTFDLRPENHQPSGRADFSKIYNPNNVVVTYENLDTEETIKYVVSTTEVTNEKGDKIANYVLPPPTSSS